MNSVSVFLPVLWSSLFVQAPLMVVALLGLVLSVVRWRTAPAASRWVFAASLLTLVVCVGTSLSQAWLTGYAPTVSLSARSWLYGASGFFWSTLRAVAAGLLLVGAYAGRGPVVGPTNLPPPVDFPPATNP